MLKGFHPEDHPEAIWFWPWPKKETRQFFEELGAATGFAPGPGDKVILKFFLPTRLGLHDRIAGSLLNELATAVGLAKLSPDVLKAVKVKPLQLENGETGSYIEAPVATLPKAAIIEIGIDLDRLNDLLPMSKREPGKQYPVTMTPDGWAIQPEE